MALTKADMAEHLFEELGLNKREAKEIVEMFFEEIRGALERGEQVKLSGFGNFDLREKKERPGRNPKTGEEIPRRSGNFVARQGDLRFRHGHIHHTGGVLLHSRTSLVGKDPCVRLGNYRSGVHSLQTHRPVAQRSLTSRRSNKNRERPSETAAFLTIPASFQLFPVAALLSCRPHRCE